MQQLHPAQLPRVLGRLHDVPHVERGRAVILSFPGQLLQQQRLFAHAAHVAQVGLFKILCICVDLHQGALLPGLRQNLPEQIMTVGFFRIFHAANHHSCGEIPSELGGRGKRHLLCGV